MCSLTNWVNFEHELELFNFLSFSQKSGKFMYIYYKLQRRWAIKVRCKVNIKENLDYLKGNNFQKYYLSRAENIDNLGSLVCANQ